MTNDTPDILIFIIEKSLSDNSKVYDLHIGDIVLNATDHAAAEELATTIVDAIETYTTQTADYIDEAC